MIKITDIRTLKVGDDIFFKRGSNKKHRWFGKVDEIKNRDKYIKIIVKMTYFALFEDYGKWRGQETKGFSSDWNVGSSWVLYKLTEKETKRYKKELILLNLK